ncbi:MAG: hypothetical protein H6Q04_2612, partial [Acidobacteria bacterium]|nr:hypothetical protein [Acidobacteriota bacterium]
HIWPEMTTILLPGGGKAWVIGNGTLWSFCESSDRLLAYVVPLAFSSLALGQGTAANSINIHEAFIHTGWMGDGENFGRSVVSFSAFEVENPL